MNEEIYLIDCGEGTQERLRQAGISFQRIGNVFISHLHGDHYLGVVGLLSTMHLLGRERPLHLFGPPELREILAIQFRASQTFLRFPLHHHDLTPANGVLLMEDDRVKVISLALKHRLPTTGFVFREQPALRKLRRDKLADIPVIARNAVKQGGDLVLPDGSTMANAELTIAPSPSRSFAYCSDTAYELALIPHLAGVDLLYHEATFSEALKARAKETHHSTAREAAMMARDAGVRRLLLGHFSSRYKDLSVLLQEAREIFPETALSEEGVSYPVDQRSIV